MPLRTAVIAFVAGFLGVIVFHQGVWAIFHRTGKVPVAPWDMTRSPPLGIPQLFSSAFWGGIWGIAIIGLLPAISGSIGRWPAGIIAGAVLTSAVALLVVFPLKGRPFAADWNPGVWVFALLVNAGWALGLMFFYDLISRFII